MFQVLYGGKDGNFVHEFRTTESKDQFVQILTNSGIDFFVKEIEDRKINVAQVVFNLSDVELAIKGKKTLYSFADPDGLATKNSIVEVKLEDGTVKPVFVVKTVAMTVSAIKKLAESLGRSKLCRVTRKVF
jgi:mitochondrial fission protein ELM1